MRRAVLVDVDPETFLVRADHVASAVTPRTRAVLAVHLFGRPVAWEELQTAVPQEVALVEDAAGALGACYRGTPCGALGLIGCLSFHPRKIVTTGEGGAVTTDEAELAAAVRRLRHHGIAAGEVPSTSRRRASTTACPTSSARSGSRSSARLESLLECPRAGRRLVRRAARAPRRDAVRRRGRPARLAGVRRDRSTVATRRWQGCASQGIEAQIGTYAVNRLSAYRDRGSFPGADAAFERALALPFATTMTEDDVERVCSALAALRLARSSVPGQPGDLHHERRAARRRPARRPASSRPSGTRARSAGSPAARSPPGRGRLERRRRRVESPSRDPQPARHAPRHQPSFAWIEPSSSTVARDPPSGEDARGEVAVRPTELDAEPGAPVVEAAADGIGRRRATRVRQRRVHCAGRGRLRADAAARRAAPQSSRRRGARLVRATMHVVTTPTAASRFRCGDGLWHGSVAVTDRRTTRASLSSIRATARTSRSSTETSARSSCRRSRGIDGPTGSQSAILLPDLAAARLDDGARVTLRDLARDRPLLLVFGSFT